MNKRIGKFKVWQLIAAGVAFGVILYIYSRGKGGTNPEELYGGTGTGAYGPIDPETGIPYAFEGGLGGGSGSSPGGGGIGEVAGLIGQLKEAGLWPEPQSAPAPEREEVVVEKEGPEPRSDAEVRAAHLATRAARKTLHKVHKELHKAEHRAKKLEHQHTQKHNSTGGSAHTPHTHHAQKHPAHRIGTAKKANAKRAAANRSAQHTENQQRKRHRRR